MNHPSNAHDKSLVTWALPRFNILKALTDTNWGLQKKTIPITYKSLFMCVTPIWSRNTSPSHIQTLQTIENSALCIAAGCVKITSINHLQEETNMLSVQDHLFLISF